LGVILVNLVCGRNPWRIASPSDESFNAYLADHEFLRRILPVSRQCLYILTRIFTVDPTERISLSKLRRLIEQIDTFTMDEEELRLAHVIASREKAKAAPVYEEELEEVVFEDWQDGDDEAVFGLDPDTETPSLRADSGSPSPPAQRSRSGSSCETSLPPTPLLSAEDARLHGSLADPTKGASQVWDLFKKQPHHRFHGPNDLRVTPDGVTVGATSPFFP
jgi:hypothetical protein